MEVREVTTLWDDKPADLYTYTTFTERKLAELELIKLRSGLEIAPLLSSYQTKNGVIEYVNPAFT